MGLWNTLRQRARRLRAEIVVLALALRHPQTPWHAKLLVLAVVAYAASPIDLIPDFIPFFGHLDDLVLLPLGIALAIRLVPATVLDECRARTALAAGSLRRAGYGAAAVVVALWLLLALYGWYRLAGDG